MQRKNIIVVPYNPKWPEMFEYEAFLIKEVLKDNCIAIHHVGSTSVPGLAAKPQIDIIAVIRDPAQAIEQLTQMGYTFKGESNIPFRLYFNDNLHENRHAKVNLHVYEEGHPEITLNLLFRDYLRSHPNVRDEYAALKETLLQDESSFQKKEGSMFTGYNLGKDAFIRRVLKETGFDQIRFLRCTHDLEWEIVRNLRQKEFFDKACIKDPYDWTFYHPDHVHLVLCEGVEVIGYAHVQLWPKNRAALRMIVIDEHKRQKGFGRIFLKFIEKWLKSQNRQSLHTESSREALIFYQIMDYKPMPFNDPDDYPSDSLDVAMGKMLI